jgi:signal transduction histidine kinase
MGTLCAIDRQPRAFTASQLDQLRVVARIAAWILETEAAPRDDRLVEATTLLRQLEEERAAERERLAITLHEGVAQDLFALRLQLQRLQTSSASRPAGRDETAAAGIELTHALDRSIGDVCEIASGLAASAPARFRIAEAIRQHAQDIAQQSGLEIQVHEVGASLQLDSATRLLVLRVAREALANITRHARACHVSIILENSGRELRLRVVDDGAGASLDVLPDASAQILAGLNERTSAAGGTLSVGRNMRGGTTLCLQLPTGVAG